MCLGVDYMTTLVSTQPKNSWFKRMFFKRFWWGSYFIVWNQDQPVADCCTLDDIDGHEV